MKKTLMIAHRGYSYYERENTLSAFSLAGITKEFYGIETDVHVTNDGHYVLIHDEDVNRVCNELVSLNVEKNPFYLVRSVRLPDLDGYTLRNDLVIPEMIEYFRVCKKYNKVAVLELKQIFTKNQIQEIYNIIDSLDMIDNTIIISFILEDLILLRQISSTIKSQWLLCQYEDKHIETLLKYNLGVDAHYSSISKESIDKLHSLNIEVNIWTVDDQNIANKYASWGVDYITSNKLKEVNCEY